MKIYKKKLHGMISVERLFALIQDRHSRPLGRCQEAKRNVKKKIHLSTEKTKKFVKRKIPRNNPGDCSQLEEERGYPYFTCSLMPL